MVLWFRCLLQNAVHSDMYGQAVGGAALDILSYKCDAWQMKSTPSSAYNLHNRRQR
jgi:hypothetical protein